jgi:hypothetical protein
MFLTRTAASPSSTALVISSRCHGLRRLDGIKPELLQPLFVPLDALKVKQLLFGQLRLVSGRFFLIVFTTAVSLRVGRFRIKKMASSPDPVSSTNSSIPAGICLIPG